MASSWSNIPALRCSCSSSGQRELSDDNQNMSYRRTHFLLQEQLDKTLPQGTRYELVDMLQGRFLLVCEQPDTVDTQTLAQTLWRSVL